MINSNNKKKQGNTAVIVIVVLFFAVVASVFVYLKFFSSNEKSGQEKTVFIYKKADLNRDEKVDQLDFQLIRDSLNCHKEDSCWQEVVGKTMDGDNPIYTYYLDLNKDGIISKKDLDFAQQGK